MPVSTSSLFPALSLASALLAATAVYLAQQQPEAIPVQTPAPFDSSRLENSISELRQEVMELQSQLKSLGKTVSETPESLTGPENEARRVQFRARETERITAAVEAAMETRGVELAQGAAIRAKRDEVGGRMTKWVGTARNKLPNLYQKIAEEMELDPETEEAVEEILETGYQTMTILSNEILEGEFPEGEELEMIAEIQGEIREEVGSMVNELDEVLNPVQMIHLGEIYIEEVDPRIGQGIVNNGYEGDSATEGQG